MVCTLLTRESMLKWFIYASCELRNTGNITKKKNHKGLSCLLIMLSTNSCWVTSMFRVLSYVVQSLSLVWFFATSSHQDPLSSTISQNLLRFISIELVMISNHLILCFPLFHLPSVFSSIRVFPNELTPYIRWPIYWNFNTILPMNIQSWFPLGGIFQGTGSIKLHKT